MTGAGGLPSWPLRARTSVHDIRVVGSYLRKYSPILYITLKFFVVFGSFVDRPPRPLRLCGEYT